jgi:hypothetical protein
MLKMESVSETLDFIIHVRRLSDREEFMEFCHHENLKIRNNAVSFVKASPNLFLSSVVSENGRTFRSSSISQNKSSWVSVWRRTVAAYSLYTRRDLLRRNSTSFCPYFLTHFCWGHDSFERPVTTTLLNPIDSTCCLRFCKKRTVEVSSSSFL